MIELKEQTKVITYGNHWPFILLGMYMAAWGFITFYIKNGEAYSNP